MVTNAKLRNVRTLCFLAVVCATLLVPNTGVLAGPLASLPGHELYSRQDTIPEGESPASQDRLIPYPEIAPTLYEIESNSNRVQVEVMGRSAGGRDLFLVTVADPRSLGRLGKYQALRHMMIKDPEKAQAMIDQFEDFKVPVFINASIHGSEPEGVDAAIELIRTLACEDTEEVRAILDNVILLVNVVANPDGRVLNQRSNANGFDLNRDFITQSQPETQATVRVLTEWNPMVLLDLHGYMNPMLIEPCTPPHNPNCKLARRWCAGASPRRPQHRARFRGWGFPPHPRAGALPPPCTPGEGFFSSMGFGIAISWLLQAPSLKPAFLPAASGGVSSRRIS